MEKKTERLIEDIEEQFSFFSALGIEFIFEDIPFKTEPKKEPSISPLSQSVDSRYVSLRERILGCRKCPLHASRRNAVPGEGSIKTELMFIGEGPGRDEDIQGKPFVGRAGQLLTRIINAMKYQRDDVYITNIVKCRPPDNRDPDKTEMASCTDFLFEQIEMIKPKVIVTLGDIPTRFFLKTTAGITSLRGEFTDYNGIKIMPTFHPSYLVRNEHNRILRKNVWTDMQKVMALLGRI